MYIVESGEINIMIPKTEEEIGNNKKEIDFIFQNILSDRNKSKSPTKEAVLRNITMKMDDTIVLAIKERFDELDNLLKHILNNIHLLNNFKEEELAAYLFCSFKKKKCYYEDGVFLMKRLNVLEKGSYFGEIALINKSSRNSSVMAKEDTTLSSFKKNKFEKIFSKANESEIRKKAFFAKYFHGLQTKTLMEMQYRFQEKLLMKNTILYRINDKVDKLYIIIDGEIKLYKKS